MENVAYSKGNHIIYKIAKLRCEMIIASRSIKSAEFRMEVSDSPNNEIWKIIKEENIINLQKCTKDYEVLYQMYMSLKHQVSPEKWESMLQTLGFTLAQTENIVHVSDMLHDSYDVYKALEQTSNMIRQKNEELKIAQANGNEDLAAIIMAELNYYEKDMKEHQSGEERLEAIYAGLKETGKTI